MDVLSENMLLWFLSPHILSFHSSFVFRGKEGKYKSEQNVDAIKGSGMCLQYTVVNTDLTFVRSEGELLWRNNLTGLNI